MHPFRTPQVRYHRNSFRDLSRHPIWMCSKPLTQSRCSTTIIEILSIIHSHYCFHFRDPKITPGVTYLSFSLSKEVCLPTFPLQESATVLTPHSTLFPCRVTAIQCITHALSLPARTLASMHCLPLTRSIPGARPTVCYCISTCSIHLLI